MSHLQQQEYCKRVKAQFPDHFKHAFAIDFGSLNINGHNRVLFEDSNYVGVDIGPGSNVDVISKAHEFDPKPSYVVDTVISTEMLEHDKYWKLSLANMYRLLRPGGLLVLTCAGPGRPEHGTRRCDKGCSPLTCADPTWMDYYKNLSMDDLRSVLGQFEWEQQVYEYDDVAKDTYFYGIKK